MMLKKLHRLVAPVVLSLAILSCQAMKSSGDQFDRLAAPATVKSFCIDFNWGEGGPNAFAKPGLWPDADPAQHVEWYASSTGTNEKGIEAKAGQELQVHHETPAKLWRQCDPLGNGRFGAMVPGGVVSEKIALNHDTLWSGELAQTPSDGSKHLAGATQGA